MRRLTLLLLTLVAGLASQLPQPVAALAPAGVAFATERGPALRSAYLVGLDLHLPSGRVVRLPLAAKHGYDSDTHLLGRSSRGWVVAAGSWFFVVEGDRARRIAPRNRGDLYVTEMLSDDGKHVISASSDQADHVGVLVFDLDGTLVGQAGRENLGGDVEDAGGDQVYVAGLDGVDLVTVGSGEEAVRVLRRGADLVSLEHDTVFVRISKQSYHRYGPTSLSDPGRARWRARFNAEDISPRGTYVLGNEGQVRRMSDGKVISNLPVRHDDGTFSLQVGWADERTIVHVVTRGDRDALRRCDVINGRCTRVVPFAKQTISLPTSVSGPFVMP